MKTVSLIAIARTSFLLATLSLLPGAGCSFHVDTNDLSGPGGDVDMTQIPPDLAMSPDLAMPPDLTTPMPPDLFGAQCVNHQGGRICSGGGVSLSSGACSTGLVFTADRKCSGDTCDSGHCNPPAGAPTCRRDGDCAMGKTCQLFTNVFNLFQQYCATPPGTGDRGVACNSDADCRWNLCSPSGAGSSCIRPCAGDGDCGGTPGSCNALGVPIEGFRVTILTCNN